MQRLWSLTRRAMQKSKRSLVFTLFALLLTYACSKTPFNYRAKYTGKWYFETSVSSFYLDGPKTNSSNTFTDTGKIKFGDEPNELNLMVKDSLIAILEITKDGEISTNYFLKSAFFNSTNDTLQLFYYSGGLGGGTRTTIQGFKL